MQNLSARFGQDVQVGSFIFGRGGDSGRSSWRDVTIGPVSFLSRDSTPLSLSPSVISGREGGEDAQRTTVSPACASGK